MRTNEAARWQRVRRLGWIVAAVAGALGGIPAGGAGAQHMIERPLLDQAIRLAADPGPVPDPFWWETLEPLRLDRKTKLSDRFDIMDGWRGKLELRLSKDSADIARASEVGFGHTVSLHDGDGWSIDLAGGMKTRFSGSRPYVLSLGPKIEYESAGYGFEMSSIFEEKLGGGAPTLEMEYQAAVIRRHRILDLGLRFEGELEAVDRGVPADGQEHGVGPFGEAEFTSAGGDRLRVKAGLLFGLNEATDDIAMKWEIKYQFGP